HTPGPSQEGSLIPLTGGQKKYLTFNISVTGFVIALVHNSLFRSLFYNSNIVNQERIYRDLNQFALVIEVKIPALRA
ncbi:MAG TPA: hypothetical protein VLM44_07590, partial [Lutibacter sp.]|nr:hypothetical protein [Lutibacter sp.]